MKKFRCKQYFILLLIVILAGVCMGCGQKPDDISSLSAGLTSYQIDLTLDTEAKSASATETITYVNTSGTILKEVDFHLYPQYFEQGVSTQIVSATSLSSAYPNGLSYAQFEVVRVKVDGVETGVNYSGVDDGILVVMLNNSLFPDESVQIYIEFNFVLGNCEHRFGYGEHTINLGNFYPIACVYEEGTGFSLEPYDANGDPFYSDMANYEVSITLDSDFLVSATGQRVSLDVAGDSQTLVFSAQLVRDFALVVSDQFSVISGEVDGIAVEYYFYDDSESERSLQAGLDALRTFADLFGDYPYQTFCIVQADFVYGGMEYPNLVIISDDIDGADDRMNVIIHETAHQWWYGMVGNDEFNFPWLDEALTEYSTLLFYDYNTGYNLTHAEMLSACKANYTLFITVYEDVLGSVDTSMRAVDEYDTEPEYTYCTYVKGVLMYESLYQLVGEKAFLNSLKEYFSANKYTNATPDDLIAAFETTTGKDMHNFFSSWLTGKVVIR